MCETPPQVTLEMRLYARMAHEIIDIRGANYIYVGRYAG